MKKNLHFPKELTEWCINVFEKESMPVVSYEDHVRLGPMIIKLAPIKVFKNID